MPRLTIHRSSAVLALLLLPFGTVIAQNVTLTLSGVAPDRTAASTRERDEVSTVTALGETVSLARAEGREYVLRAAGGFFWTGFDTVPTAGEYLRLRPERGEDGNYVVHMEVARQQAGRRRHYTSTVIAAPGKWVRLWGPPEEAHDGRRQYSTRSVQEDALYLKVSP